MDLTVAIQGREYRMRVAGRDPVEVVIEGRTFQFHVGRTGDGLVLERDGRRHFAHIEGESLVIDGRPIDATFRRSAAAASLARAGGAVTPPMPGRIVSVAVVPGDVVKRGSPLLVMESMKMQNEIPAPLDGVVQEVKVIAGQRVAAGEILVLISNGRRPDEKEGAAKPI